MPIAPPVLPQKSDPVVSSAELAAADTHAAPARPPLRLALPKGRMQEGVFALLEAAGIHVRVGSRGYRPRLSIPGIDAKMLKPQSILEMLDGGSRDIGFAGADWATELGADVVEALDTGLDTVQLVLAAPDPLLKSRSYGRPLVIASEYERLTRAWIAANAPDARFVHSYGATEVFPPEDADAIIDITATGDTLRAQGLVVIDELMRSSTRLYASRAAVADPERRAHIDAFVLLLRSVLDARQRVMLETNVSASALERLVALLPCMREPTISPLHGGAGYAIKAAVPRADLPLLIPRIKACGGADIVVTQPSQIIP